MRSLRGLRCGLAVAFVVALFAPLSSAHTQSVLPASALVFAKHTVATQMSGASPFHAADVDSDGDTDILAALGTANYFYFVWLENNGAQTFATHKVYATFAMDITSFFATDLDGDGDVDILAAAYPQDWVGWWENDGHQNFTMHTLRSLDGAFGVVAADLDADGDTDIVAAGSQADRVEWGENDGSQGFTWRILASGIDAVRSVSTPDMDGDGDPDVLAAGRGGGIHWCENRGRGAFAQHTVIAAWDAGSARAADMDADGDMDILAASVSGNRIAWWRNDGRENFSRRDAASTVSPYFAYPEDMDGDGDLDVLSQGAGYPTWWENDGNLAFAERPVTGGDTCQSAIPADVDGDGDTDVVGGDFYGGEVAWWESNAGESWPDFALESLTVSPSELETMENAAIFIDIRNVGLPSCQTSIQAHVTLRDTSTGTEYLWIFPGTLEALDTNESAALDIHPFTFYDSAVDEVRVCIQSDEAEANPQNNCKTVSVVLSEPPKPWQGCIGSLIAIADALLDATPAKQVTDGAKLITHIFALQVPGIVVACSAGEDSCADAVTAFLVDSAIGLARLGGDATALKILAVGHSAIQAFKDSLACGDYLGASLRAWNENANHRGVKVNAVGVRSPAYVRAVDSVGRRAGFLDNGAVVAEIPGADVFALDGEKFALYPGDATATVELKGTGAGLVNLIASFARPPDATVAAEYRAVSVTAATRGAIAVSAANYTLLLDDNGDGIADRAVSPDSVAEERVYRVWLPSVRANR